MKVLLSVTWTCHFYERDQSLKQVLTHMPSSKCASPPRGRTHLLLHRLLEFLGRAGAVRWRCSCWKLVHSAPHACPHRTIIAFAFPWSAMEPLCPLLLAGFSLPLTRALQGNESTAADGNWTAATSGPPDAGASQPLLVWLLLPLLLGLLLLPAAYFFRFKKQRKAVVSSGDKKMPNGLLEEQEQQRVMLLSRSPSGPKKHFPIPVEQLEEEVRLRSARRRQALPRGVQLAAVWTRAGNV
uniref:Uncharacterized protein n=1 Tax=Oryctolagus cuniculus TaxID=9986 RepID=A0A5F9CL29_RABIT